MPPPNVGDEWLAGRRFGIVIDAGSSGSRLLIYSWKDARVVRIEQGPKSYRSLPKVEKGTRDSEQWMFKVEPGISTFGDNPDGVASHLVPLLEHARTYIPPSMQHETPIFLLATAGMRLLPAEKQKQILDSACHFLKFHSHFRLDKPSADGPCGASIRIISGEEEGLFGWLSVNYLMDQFSLDDDQTTYGFLDMGGASTQIAFEPSAEERKKTKDLIDVRLRLIGGEEIHHQVFVTTWLGYGTNQARERYLSDIVSHYEQAKDAGIADSSSDVHDPVPDPCLPQNLVLTESLTYPAHEDSRNRKERVLVGIGSFEQCLKQVSPLLRKDSPCQDAPCPFNGVHVPHIDFSASHFIGVSEYWYSTEHVFGLGGPYDFVQFERAASEFCARDWEDIMEQHRRSKEQGALGGDGEVEEGGKVVSVGKWGDKVELSRLQMQCFKSAWLVNVLHDGLGMPRIVDPGGNSTEEPEEEVEEMAKQKGLGRPRMQSLDVIGDTAISWTLGKMVLEASREVPPLSKDVAPIPDPLGHSEDKTESTASSQFSIGQILPDFTPFGLLIYAICLILLVSIARRLRNSIGLFARQVVRRTLRRGNLDNSDRLTMEEGRYLNGGLSATQSKSWLFSFPSSSRFVFSIRSFLSRLSPATRSRPSPFSNGSISRNNVYSPTSTRSFSFPLQQKTSNGTGGGIQYSSSFANASDLPPRSSTPQFRRESTVPNGNTSSLSSLPRSRNASQINLTALVSRQTISRSGSGQQTPIASYDDGD